jgi:hypothetical protein
MVSLPVSYFISLLTGITYVTKGPAFSNKVTPDSSAGKTLTGEDAFSLVWWCVVRCLWSVWCGVVGGVGGKLYVCVCEGVRAGCRGSLVYGSNYCPLQQLLSIAIGILVSAFFSFPKCELFYLILLIIIWVTCPSKHHAAFFSVN